MAFINGSNQSGGSIVVHPNHGLRVGMMVEFGGNKFKVVRVTDTQVVVDPPLIVSGVYKNGYSPVDGAEF
jgi:hypothetical protein